MFWNKRKTYRTEVNAKIEGLLGFKPTDLFPILTYAEQLDKAYDSKFSTTSGCFFVLILFYVSAIEGGGDNSMHATLLKRNGLLLNDILIKILDGASQALIIEPNSRPDIEHLLSFINKAHLDFGLEAVALPFLKSYRIPQ
jgi:hypothetical protein